MTRLHLALLVALPLAMWGVPAAAQSYTGNWACIANIDGTKAGILTILAGNYGYASANYGSKASGTGTVTMYQDGVMFENGNLLVNAGINAGRLTQNEVGDTIMVLTTPEKPILTCKPRG